MTSPLSLPAPTGAPALPLRSDRPAGASPRGDPVLDAARELEASFLAEMLKAAGLGRTRQSFGGGAGEDAFSSFLVTEQARALVQAGGIGLAERIRAALMDGPPPAHAARPSGERPE